MGLKRLCFACKKEIFKNDRPLDGESREVCQNSSRLVEASVALREAPDDHEEGNDAGKTVAADFIDEPNEVLSDRREVPTLVRAEDDVDDDAKCDQHQRQIQNILRPAFDLFNRVHVFFSGQVIIANPPSGVGVQCSIRAAHQHRV